MEGLGSFADNLHATVAIASESHTGGAGTAEPEMFNAVLRLRSGWSHQSGPGLLGRFNHEDLAFAQVDQLCGAGRVGTLGEHVETSFHR